MIFFAYVLYDSKKINYREKKTGNKNFEFYFVSGGSAQKLIGYRVNLVSISESDSHIPVSPRNLK